MRGRWRPAGAERILACAIAALVAWPACAQVGVSAAIQSDYRVRGVSYSDGKPAASLTVTYDHKSGAYVAFTGVVGDTPWSGVQPLGYQAVLGYAARARSGLVWDVGVANARFTEYLRPRYEIDYSEVYAGVAGKNLSAHLYYSPNYLGQHVETLYGEVDGVVSPAPRLRLFSHAGLLQPLNPRPGAEIERAQYDLRAGAALEFDALELRLAWTSVQRRADYLGDRVQARNAVIATATYAF